MSTKNRIEIMNTKLLLVATYGAVLFAGETMENREIFHSAVMSVYCLVKNRFVFKEKCKDTCKVIGVHLPSQVLINCAAAFSHKVVRTKKPLTIFKTIHTPHFPRACQELSSILSARTIRRKRCLLYRITKIFNNIPAELKMLNPNIFKLRLKKYDIADTSID